MIISNQMIIPNLKIISGRPGGGIVPGSQPSGVQVRGRGGVTDIANLFIFRKTFWSCPDWLVTFRWVPTSEKPVFLSFAYVGGTFGTIVTYPVGISGQNAKRRNHHQMQRYYRIKTWKLAPQMCGLIIEQLGWEAVFYITAGITVLWVIIWQVRWCVFVKIWNKQTWTQVLVSELPEESRFISDKEKDYIIANRCTSCKSITFSYWT